MPFRRAFYAFAVIALLAIGCGGDSGGVSVSPSPPLPSPSPSDASGVTPGAHNGRTAITFLGAEPAPGATLTGCGRDGTACSGRIRMSFRLLNATGGPVLYTVAFLHATNLVACWRGDTGPLRLEAGVASDVSIVFDQPDTNACGAPADIATMKLVVVGPVEVDSLQEWAVRYALRP